ncbi:transcriptional regulator [Xanthobacter sp. TB0139]|uniref:transcriptional regulator n=1 Tax=Xanthobacter sp. TB0139 TaxID=3459178 RepID=UPI00403A43BE
MTGFRDHISRAVQIRGSQLKLAQAAGCSQQQISFLLSRARRISAEMALRIEAATDGAVSRHDLRPDVFGAGPEATIPHPPALEKAQASENCA